MGLEQKVSQSEQQYFRQLKAIHSEIIVTLEPFRREGITVKLETHTVVY